MPRRKAVAARQGPHQMRRSTSHGWTCAWARSRKCGGIQLQTGDALLSIHGACKETASAPPWVDANQASDAVCSLYVEEVDIGEQEPRQVVSGLVKFVPEVGFTGRRK